MMVCDTYDGKYGMKSMYGYKYGKCDDNHGAYDGIYGMLCGCVGKYGV